MRNERGFTLMEVVVVMGVIGLLAAVAIPSMQVAAERNKVITTADLVAAQIREARLAAITRNTTFRVMFDCPAPGCDAHGRVHGHAGDRRCGRSVHRTSSQTTDLSSTCRLASRSATAHPSDASCERPGEFTAEGAGMPQNIFMAMSQFQQRVNVTAAGRVRTRSRNGERGFTLVETIVAAAILIVGLVALAELLAVSVRMHQIGRDSAQRRPPGPGQVRRDDEDELLHQPGDCRSGAG